MDGSKAYSHDESTAPHESLPLDIGKDNPGGRSLENTYLVSCCSLPQGYGAIAGRSCF